MTMTEPTPDRTAPSVLRSARALRSGRAASMVGEVARRADAFVAGVGVAASQRRTDPRPPSPEGPATLPWGLWSRSQADDDTLLRLDPALAGYAAQLRARRAPVREPARRGLPIVARRAGATEHGPGRGPGGLAASLRPVEQSVPPIDDVRRKGV